MKLTLKVVPGSSKEGIAGWLGDTLKIRVTAPPENGKANTAVERILSRSLNLPAMSVKIIAGRASSRKVVEIVGIDDAEIHARLNQC